MDILFLEPIYKKIPWGGNNIAHQFSRTMPDSSKIGESWEICARKNDSNAIVRYFKYTFESLSAKRFKNKFIWNQIRKSK